MAAHLRSVIRHYVGGNHFSPPFSQLSAARPSMGARFCSSSSTPSSPDQALRPRLVKKHMWEYVQPAFVVVFVFSVCQVIDIMGIRTSYKEWTDKIAREGEEHLLADVVMMQRDIETIKMRRSERVPKNEPTKNEPTTGWLAFRFW